MIVQVVERLSEKVVKQFTDASSHRAEKIAAGLRINLDHDRFEVRLVEASHE